MFGRDRERVVQPRRARCPSYYFLDFVENTFGGRCWMLTAAFTAIVGYSLSVWIGDALAVLIVGGVSVSVLVRCALRRHLELKQLEDS